MRDGNTGGIGCASMMAVALTPCASDDDGWRARAISLDLVSDTVGTKMQI